MPWTTGVAFSSAASHRGDVWAKTRFGTWAAATFSKGSASTRGSAWTFLVAPMTPPVSVHWSELSVSQRISFQAASRRLGSGVACLNRVKLWPIPQTFWFLNRLGTGATVYGILASTRTGLIQVPSIDMASFWPMKALLASVPFGGET